MGVQNLVSESEACALRKAGVEAAQRAGQILLKFFGKTYIEIEKPGGDLLTDADLASDEAIRKSLAEAGLSQRVVSEEDGSDLAVADGLYWLVDPLDGTNNFTLGIPVFGVSLTLMMGTTPLMSIVNFPILQQLYVTERGRGVTMNGERLTQQARIVEGDDLGVVCFVLGYLERRSPLASRLLLRLRAASTRVLELWSPTVSWCLVAKYRVDSIISIDPCKYDSLAGVLTLEESGGIVSYVQMPQDGEGDQGQMHPILVGSRTQAVHERVIRCIMDQLHK